MVNIYTYNDLRGYDTKLHNVKSNLCTYYYSDKKKFCGNYCSRKGRHGHKYNRRCWRHKVPKQSAVLPPVILLMISASERTYNREIWIRFLEKCEEKKVPLELVVYHEDMNNCTVRESHNIISRFRPFPDIFGKVLPLRNLHGSINFTQIYLRMLEYGCNIPHAARCIVLTERTLPIRSPLTIYKTAMASKCHIDVSYNVAYGPVPPGLPRSRGKPYAGVNNLCQGLFTTEFLKAALPTLQQYSERFGISFNNGVYTITDRQLFDQWREFTGANPSEFWLLNSFLLHHNEMKRPMSFLQRYMEKSDVSERYTVAEIPQWRDNWKRTFVFRNWSKRYTIPQFDLVTKRYYRDIDITSGISLKEVVHYLRKHKKRALFFRQIELP